MFRALLALVLLPSLALAQAEEKLEIRNLGQCGLVTRYASSQIGDTCLQEAENVYLDEDAGITRRRGFSKFNTTAITDSKSVRGVWPFRATDGTEYLVAISSETMFQSDGDGSFSAISPAISGLSSTQDMDCQQCLGKLWCVNGSNTMFFWDGSSTGTVSGAPTCSAIDCFRNRIALTNCSGTLSQLRMSGELDGTDWTISASPVSTSPVAISIGGVNDGKKVQCIQGVYQDVLVLGKEDSTWGLYGFDRRDFAVREISREVGCIENRSGREKQGSLYWLSKRGVEKMTGPSITRVSDPIRDLVDTIIVAGGNSRSAVDTSQSDFQAGNLTAAGAGAPMSATISPGNVVVTTGTLVDTNGSDWVSGTIVSLSTSDVPGSLTLHKSTFTDTFSDNQFTSNPSWDNIAGDYWSAANGYLTGGASGDNINGAILVSTYNVSYGVYQFDLTITNGGTAAFDIRVGIGCTNYSPSYLGSTTNNYCTTGNGYQFKLSGVNDTVADVELQKGTAGTFAAIAACSVSYTFTSGSAVTYKIVRDTNGLFTIYADGVYLASCTDNAYTSSAMIGVQINKNDSSYRIDNIEFYNYDASGSLVSRTFDTGVSTPVGGAFVVNQSSATDWSATFEIQDSVDGLSWGSLASITPGNRVTNQRRYWRYKISYTQSVTSTTARVDDVTLTAATTGYFIGQCRNPGTGITQWGLFQCNSTLNGGNISFEVASGTTCNSVIVTTAPWTSQTNNTIVSVATNPYVSYRVLFNVDAASETPTLHDCTINWNEGTTRPAVAAEVYRDRYYLAYTSVTAGSVANDRLLVLDSRDQWVLHDQPNCNSLTLYNRKLFCGDSASSGLVYRMDVGHDDDGASFTSTIKTKDFDFGNAWQKKHLMRMYFDLAGLPNQDYEIGLTPSYTLDASTDVVTLNDINLNEDYSRFIPAKVPADLSKNTSARWYSFGLTNTRSQGPWKLFGLKIIFSRLSED